MTQLKCQSVFQDIIKHTAKLLQERVGVEPDEAVQIGTELAIRMRELWGGMSIYIGKTDFFAIDERHKKIYEAWRKGEDEVSLAKLFNLTEQRVRQIISQKVYKKDKSGQA